MEQKTENSHIPEEFDQELDRLEYRLLEDLSEIAYQNHEDVIYEATVNNIDDEAPSVEGEISDIAEYLHGRRTLGQEKPKFWGQPLGPNISTEVEDYNEDRTDRKVVAIGNIVYDHVESPAENGLTHVSVKALAPNDSESDYKVTGTLSDD